MKKILVMAALMLGVASVAFGADCSTFSGQQVTTIPVSGCTIDGGLITLSHFQVDNFGGATGVFVSTNSGFVVNWTPSIGSPSSSQDIHFEYEVSGLAISSVSLTSSGSVGSNIQEEVCTLQIGLDGSPFCGPTAAGGNGGTLLANMQVFGTGGTFQVISPTQPIWAWKDIHTDIGASISAFSQDFTVPEPGTLTLLGSGLIGLAGLLRRKLRA